MLSLERYVDEYLTPVLLNQTGLPDTTEGREVLDMIVRALVDHAPEADA